MEKKRGKETDPERGIERLREGWRWKWSKGEGDSGIEWLERDGEGNGEKKRGR